MRNNQLGSSSSPHIRSAYAGSHSARPSRPLRARATPPAGRFPATAQPTLDEAEHPSASEFVRRSFRCVHRFGPELTGMCPNCFPCSRSLDDRIAWPYLRCSRAVARLAIKRLAQRGKANQAVVPVCCGQSVPAQNRPLRCRIRARPLARILLSTDELTQRTRHRLCRYRRAKPHALRPRRSRHYVEIRPLHHRTSGELFVLPCRNT